MRYSRLQSSVRLAGSALSPLIQDSSLSTPNCSIGRTASGVSSPLGCVFLDYSHVVFPMFKVAARCRKFRRGSFNFEPPFTSLDHLVGERDRHVDLPDAAFFARGDVFDISHGAGSDFIEPVPATGTRSWRRPVLRMKTARFRHVSSQGSFRL
jgi:hypothetical protein